MTNAEPGAALGLFHPTIARWFREAVGTPTETQTKAWPEIAAGRHVLVTAPTGSGKTLTAFLWALNELLTGAMEGGRTRVLYVSPLKALNNDIRRNLLAPLAALEKAFAAAGESAEPVRVATRSGDTPSKERQRMIRRPPEILITTPESLNILLTSKGGRSLLGGLATVILDEIHAVAGSKRGTHLITGVDRLVPLAGEFQRIALSATVRPPERVARFIGGYEIDRVGGEARYRARPVTAVGASEKKRYDLKVAFPEDARLVGLGRPGERSSEDLADLDRPPEGLWTHLTAEFKRRIRSNRSTLLFGNSRRVVEKITRYLNEDESDELAYSHHGSLSREIRSVVEKRLKEGRLKAIAATNSLELGIDIGALDEVILLRTPPSVASAVQRIGRAGHRVGKVSRGRLYPLFGRDFLDAAVVAASVLDQDIEEVWPIEGALDVLAQILLSMTAVETWGLDELYDAVRASRPYRELPRRQFDLVIEMLAGRYADSRIRELEPRVSIDRVAGTVKARPGAARLVFFSGGTIPDRGYFHLRLADTRARLGELDEEFVWERSLGDTFTLGTQNWRIVKITHNDVLVTPARASAAMAPFWRAEPQNRSFHLSERIGVFLERAEEILDSRAGAADLAARLERDHCMEASAAARLVDLLESQRSDSGAALPHRRHLLVERFEDPSSRQTMEEGKQQVVLHNFWGGRVNRPLAIALASAWEERYGYPLEVDSDNDCVLAALPREVEVEELLELVREDNVETLLRRRLERTGFFGSCFRENAGRALLLPRSDLKRRVPLWLNRERAKKLLAAVARYQDFPVLVETWRACLRDEFEIESLKLLLGELARGEIRVGEAVTRSPSPFAAGLVWQQTNRLMYEDDTPSGGGATGLSQALLRELVFSSQLRPRLPAEMLDRFQRKLHRTFPGYAPRDAEELVDWVKERLVIPEREWRQLVEAVGRDRSEVPVAEEGETESGPARGSEEAAGERHGVPGSGLDPLLRLASRRLVRLHLPLAGSPDETIPVICALENLSRLDRALGIETARRLAPLHEGSPPPAELRATLEDLVRSERRGGDEASDPLAALVAEWIRFYGPFPRQLLRETFGLDEEAVLEVLETLTDAETVVIDQFREVPEGAEEAQLEVCDAENLERLLRILRAAARPAFEALPLDRLPQFLATLQGLAAPADGVGGLQAALERLFAYPAPAALWESDLLPARLDPYYPSWLDSLMQESDLSWVGCGPEKLTFAFPADLELMRDAEDGRTPSDGAPEPLQGVFPDPRGRYPLEDLARHSGSNGGALTRRLWDLAWEGRVSNTTYLAVRRGLLSRFEPAAAAAPDRGRRRSPARRASRRRFEGWRATRAFAGDWYLLDPNGETAAALDALDLEELNKERVRVLLERYGVLFRELLARELPALRWGRVFRSLRLMELSGEVFSGHFFSGIHGLQFASHAALRRLREGLPDDAVYWMNALDPASPCGLGLEDLKGELPARLPSSHLVYHGPRLVLVSKRSGGELDVRVAPDHPRLADYLEFLKVLLTRQFDPLRAVDVETINGESAVRSPYGPRLAEIFAVTREVRSLRLRRRY